MIKLLKYFTGKCSNCGSNRHHWVASGGYYICEDCGNTWT